MRAPASPLGRDGPCTAWHPAPLEQVPGFHHHERRPASPGRSARPGSAPSRRHDACLADRSPVNGDRARHARCPGVLRACGQALWRDHQALPATPGQPQGCGRGQREIRMRPLVADHDRPDARRGAGEPRSLLRDDRRRPGQRRFHCPRAGGGRTPAAIAAGALSGHLRAGGPGRLIRPDRLPGRPLPSPTGLHRGHLEGASAPGEPHGRDPGLGRRHRRPSRGPRCRRRPCERKGNYPPGPAARAAAAALLGGSEAREVVVDLARYAELVEAAR